MNDWIQAGRYALGIDALALAGGPTSPAPTPALMKGPGPGERSGRILRIGNGVLLESNAGEISVFLDALGDESGASFSINFDNEALQFTGAVKGSGIGDANLVVNIRQAGSGKLGVAFATMNKALDRGQREIVRLSFRSAGPGSGTYPLLFGDLPVPRGLSDTNALALSADYLNGIISVNPLPALDIRTGSAGVQVAWPLWATNYMLEATEGSPMASAAWQTITGIRTNTTGEFIVLLPADRPAQYFRLRR